MNYKKVTIDNFQKAIVNDQILSTKIATKPLIDEFLCKSQFSVSTDLVAYKWEGAPSAVVDAAPMATTGLFLGVATVYEKSMFTVKYYPNIQASDNNEAEVTTQRLAYQDFGHLNSYWFGDCMSWIEAFNKNLSPVEFSAQYKKDSQDPKMGATDALATWSKNHSDLFTLQDQTASSQLGLCSNQTF